MFLHLNVKNASENVTQTISTFVAEMHISLLILTKSYFLET